MSKTKPKPRIKAILFDLGKVILHFNFEPAFRRLSRASRMTAKDIEDTFLGSGLEVLYDGGKISSQKFYREVRKTLGHSLDYARFKKTWNEIFTPNPKVIALIRRLKPHYRLVLISNTNAMHYAHVRKKYPALGLFDEHILSFREKVRKPDEQIYRKALRACRAKPSEILYIDDRPDLTDAAKSMGFHVCTYRRHEELTQKIKELAVL